MSVTTETVWLNRQIIFMEQSSDYINYREFKQNKEDTNAAWTELVLQSI